MYELVLQHPSTVSLKKLSLTEIHKLGESRKGCSELAALQTHSVATAERHYRALTDDTIVKGYNAIQGT